MREFIQHSSQNAGISPAGTGDQPQYLSSRGGEFLADPGQSPDPGRKINSAADNILAHYGYEEDMKGRTGDFGGVFGM